jgi:hypothetical protein
MLELQGEDVNNGLRLQRAVGPLFNDNQYTSLGRKRKRNKTHPFRVEGPIRLPTVPVERLLGDLSDLGLCADPLHLLLDKGIGMTLESAPPGMHRVPTLQGISASMYSKRGHSHICTPC